MKFDSFLFVKSSSFSSIIANDILMQSFTPSKQQNKPRIHKTALFLTNCLHNGLPEYKTQQYIKDKIYDNENTKENVLFLSAMYRVKKVIFVRELIENLTNLFQRLERYAYYNQIQQVHYLTQKLGKLIKEYHAGRVKYQRHDISSYSLDDKKLCAMNERDFCNFIYDLCQIFITEKHVEMFNKYMDNTFTRHYWYGNDKQKLLKAKADIQETFKSIMAIVLDVSKLFSHFNAYEIARLKEYQKEIEEEYKKQRDKIEKFFEIKSFESEINKQVAPNIFYQAQNTKKLCVALLDKYFNNKMNANEDLESLLKQAKERIQKEQSKAEQSLQTNNKSVYHQITIEYVISLLPLNESFLNCLEEKDRFLFCRLIICEISEFAKSANSNIAYDFLANYEVTIDLYALINLKDKEFEELLHQNGVKEVVEAFYEIFMDSNKDTSKNELKERLKKIGDEYGIASVTAFRDSSMKDKIKDVSLKIAEKLDEKYFNLPDVKISKGTFLLAAVANSVISYLCNVILDKIFPVQIDSIKDMKQQAIVLIFALNRHTNTPYATCRQGSEYLTFPIEITQTLVNADLQALIIGGSILNSGLFMHTPSVALFNENQENATRILKENIRHFINSKANINKIGKKGGEIVKEAYAKLWFYLDMGENQALESYLRNELQVKSSYYRLENLTSDKYIQTKLKKAKELDNSNENFVEVEGNKNGGIKFNQDFLIQLKRVAEWNYRVYEEKEVLPELQQDYEENDDSSIKDTSPDEWLCGNLIYDEDFIPTTIDIMD
nr:hypothetical protein [uncultured Helicobacter sp.]